MQEPLNSFAEKLKSRLREPLPGELAHNHMMPLGRREEQRELLEHPIDRLKLGGVLIMLFQYDNKIAFPLTLRHTYPGVHSGQVSLPGGKKEEQDEDIISTALRETEEEIGVPVNEIQVLGTLSDLYIPPSRYKITPAVGYVQGYPRFETDPYEVKELFIADIEHITLRKFRKTKEILVREKYRLNTPYFDIHGKVVWGATGMILSEFSQIIEEINQKL